jgi:hypothetical protein
VDGPAAGGGGIEPTGADGAAAEWNVVELKSSLEADGSAGLARSEKSEEKNDMAVGYKEWKDG